MARRMRRATASILPWLSIGGFLVAWEVGFRVAGLNPKLFPPPSAIFSALGRLLRWPDEGGIPVIFEHIGASIGRLAVAMAIAVAAGPLIGMAMGTDRRVYGALAPISNVLIAIPPYAYIPFLLLWLGHGSPTIVSSTALAAALPLIYTTSAGVRAIDRKQVWVLQTFGARRSTVFARVILPSALAAIVSGLRQSFGQAWRTLIGAEFIAATSSGLGYLIFNARNFLAVDTMFAGLILISAFGFVSIYALVDLFERRTLVRWGLLRDRML